MENECEALPGVAYPGVRDNRSTINTKTGYDDMMIMILSNTRNQYASPPRQCNTGRPLEQFLSKFRHGGGCLRSVDSRQTSWLLL